MVASLLGCNHLERAEWIGTTVMIIAFFSDNPRPNRILMNVINLLIDQCVVIEFHRITGVLPDLKLIIFRIVLGMKPKHMKQPIFSAFPIVSFDKLNKLFSRKTFEIPNKITQSFLICSSANKMNMAGHDHISINF